MEPLSAVEDFTGIWNSRMCPAARPHVFASAALPEGIWNAPGFSDEAGSVAGHDKITGDSHHDGNCFTDLLQGSDRRFSGRHHAPVGELGDRRVAAAHRARGRVDLDLERFL